MNYRELLQKYKAGELPEDLAEMNFIFLPKMSRMMKT